MDFPLEGFERATLPTVEAAGRSESTS